MCDGLLDFKSAGVARNMASILRALIGEALVPVLLQATRAQTLSMCGYKLT